MLMPALRIEGTRRPLSDAFDMAACSLPRARLNHILTCLEEPRRIGGPAIDQNFVVQMGTGAAAGAAELANLLMRPDMLAPRGENTVEMGVARHHAVAMIDLDDAAIGALDAGEGDDAGTGAIDRRKIRSAAFHPGLDLGAPYLSAVYSTGPGVVAFTGVKGAYGRVVEIDHGHGMVTRYAHLHRILVARGQHVGTHQQVGELGSTGRSTGPHLHYEVLVDGRPADPARFLEAGKNVVQASTR